MDFFNELFRNIQSNVPHAPQPKSNVSKYKKPWPRAVRYLVNVLVCALYAFVAFYIWLPALNFQFLDFYSYAISVLAVFLVVSFLTRRRAARQSDTKAAKHVRRLPAYLIAALIAFLIVGGIASAQIFRAADYRDLLTVQDGNFVDDIEEISFDQIPMLDKESAEKLGDRQLGSLADMVSQFEVSSNYAQINYQNRPVRVTPLEYGDIIKWFKNRGEGIPAYVIVDMVTQEANIVRLDDQNKSIKYTTNEHFGRYLMRHLRFQYPTFLFSEPTFEIDEEGTPYWICPRLVKRIGLFGGTDVEGAVLVNATNGESVYYNTADVPQWVDRVYPADLIVEQYDYHGTYKNGFWNSIFGQTGVTVTTEGYNYIAMNDDVYLYTGITSIGSDQSNIGFILTNQRTKQTTFYPVSGATEYSAMSSAEGVVQHLAYKATFPLLLNISDQPTYFMALKDAAQLVKQYAMVNVQQYQIVATGSSVEECEREYIRLLQENSIETSQPSNQADEVTLEGKVEDIRTAVIGGNSYYYLRLQGNPSYFRIAASSAQDVVILNVGDTVSVTYQKSGNTIIDALSVTKK